MRDRRASSRVETPVQFYSDTDRAMIDFALRWVNHGGGPDEAIQSAFGVSTQSFYRSVLDILDRNPGSVFGEFGLSPVMVTRIKAIARRRIWLAH